VKQRAHSFTFKICHWLYCAKCGLVLLKNDVTRRRVRAACPGSEE
jgi:hypothetical protein